MAVHCKLTAIAGDQAGWSMVLQPGETLSIGRSDESTLVLLGRALSRQHCVLQMQQAGCTLRDLGSSNGTFLNGAPITRETPLADGDRIRIGDHVLAVQLPGLPQSGEPTVLTGDQTTLPTGPPRCNACEAVIGNPGDAIYDGALCYCAICGYVHQEATQVIDSALDGQDADSSTFLPSFSGSDTEVGRKIDPERLPGPMRPQVTLGRRRIGHFIVQETLGAGTMGVVYRAWDEQTEQWVALKLMQELPAQQSMTERFIEEARICASLHHPGIVRCHDVGRAGPLLYLSLQYVEGIDLQTHLQLETPDLATTLAWGDQLSRALEYAHNKGVIHRDLKLSNILLTVTGRLMIIDFGLARAMQASGIRLTGSGQLLGTPLFMAPEQISDPQQVDHRADLYALGVLLFYLLTGRYPISGEGSIHELLTRKLTAAPDRLRDHRPDLPEPLDTLLARLMASAPADRPESALAVKHALEALPR